ncbi:TlpA family protein disulfide reductase [Paraconexibacter antarcticus]|uniref:TlpA family protein disulfide reductase n=1 Tax=Paraconexibacter antarcticus TaxID=2949664 RepID=A0ABY5DPN6_9ACTN|nr:TlpA disulfide reductase family protein [Paraconexibacter antarcticus]UTI63998.1 TlpA family protein disulfide reductase [Paraconexibacter antarcticus]
MDPDNVEIGTPKRRVRFVVPAVSVGVALALVGLLAYGVLAKSPNTRIDERLAHNQSADAPGYHLKVLRRGTLGPRLQPGVAPALADGWVSPQELRGTPYVFNIWASWCVPCREEAPLLVREWHRARPQGVLFVGLNMQDFGQDAQDFMNHFGVDYLNIRDPSNTTMRRYGATGIPESYFISARGQVVGHVIGVITKAQLRDGIAAAISGRPQTARQGGDRRPAR